MQLKIATLLSLLPLFAQATPTPAVSERRIALTKRSSVAKGGVVDVSALQSHIAQVRGKIARGFSNYEKNIGFVHPNYRNITALRKRDTGSVALTDDDQLLWQGTISVGTPPVDFAVDFDTGSSDFFLPGSNCDESCRGHTVYNPSASSSSHVIGRNFRLEFGDGSSVSGELFGDTVTLGGLTAADQHVGAAVEYSVDFEDRNFSPDGLLGMAFQEISEFNSPPVFESLSSQGQTDAGQFGFTLLGFDSELFLGGVDNSKFSGDLAFTEVTVRGFWQIELEGVSVGSQSVSGSQDAIVDTGTSLVIGDTETVRQIYDAIPGAQDASDTVGSGFFSFPCDSVPDNVALTLGGQQFTISADSINIGPLTSQSSDCIGGIMADDSQGFWILGDVFLRNVYTAFDVDNEQVGFARL